MRFLTYARYAALIGALASAVPAALSIAQTSTAPQPAVRDGTVLRTGVALVRIDATVTDARGRQVSDLGAGDFEVLQDGRPQQISTFEYVRAGDVSVESEVDAAPLGPSRPVSPDRVRRTIAFVVDDLGLSIDSTMRARKALEQFLDTAMRPGDLVAILRTGAGMGSLQQFTSDRRMLQAAVDRLQWNTRSRGSPFQAPIDEVDAFRNEVLSAGTLGAITYVIRGVADLPGRKSVIVLSDGFRLKDKDGTYGRVLDALRTMVDAATRAGVVVYGVDTRGLVATGPTASDVGPGAEQVRSVELRETHEGLGALAEETGGLFFRNTNDIGGGVRSALEDQQGYYLIGYVPDGSTFTGSTRRFHKLTVRVRRPGLRVRSRSGFLAVPDGAATNRPAANRLVAAVTSPFFGAGVRLRLSSFFRHEERVGPVLQSVLHVDARDLTFAAQPDGSSTTEVETLAVTFGVDGQIADQDSSRYTLRLPPGAYPRALERGFVHRIRVPLKRPGPYQVRIALRDIASERIGSASQFIDVPDVRKGRLTLSGLFIDGVSQRSAAAAGNIEDEDPRATVALRTFRQGTEARYGCEVYNAQRGRDRNPQLDTEIRLYRDGVEVLRTPGAAVPFVDNDGLLIAGGILKVGSTMPPGSYVLELVVTDRLNKKPARATQTIDFDVVQ